MLKKSIAILALLAASSAYADADDWKIKSASGGVATVMPSTVRTYTNRLGTTQHDALVELKDDTMDNRFRFAVTGCGDLFGLIAIVSPNGEPIGNSGVRNWALEGTKIYDQIAVMICLAAKDKAVSQKPKKGTL